MTDYIKEQAIYVSQPYSDFYVASIPVGKLVNVCYSFPAEYGEGALNGVQRGLNEKRVRDISKFSLTENALFPNAIILSANILSNGESVSQDKEWFIDNNSVLHIPTKEKCASIVDGQHRLAGLALALESGNLDPEFMVVCAIYMKMQAPQQAEIFATINFNQQKVDKSLAYQLFGYDLDSTERERWSPDTLATYISRLLNEEKTPFKNMIHSGTQYDRRMVDGRLKLSTSTIVEGILKLISSNSTNDRYKLHQKKIFKNKRSDLPLGGNPPPLREFYLKGKDDLIYTMILDYFNCLQSKVWSVEFMSKTIGIQASFDVFKLLLEKYELNMELILNCISDLNEGDLSKIEINYSGIGRIQIKKEMCRQLDL